jgi:lipopolysaccharide transport protein LptA
MRTRSPLKNLLPLALLVLPLAIPTSFADALSFNSDDTVTISADRGWEADEPDVLHFAGNFELHAPDWSMSGDSAVVYGKLDNPDKVVVEGNPAKISFLRKDPENSDAPDPTQRVDGMARFVEYFRATDQLIMRGGAQLLREDNKLSSEIIEYDVDKDRYSTSGEGRINVEFNPERD